MADGQHVLDVLREDDGLLIEVESKMLEVIQGVQETGKAGTVTIKLTIKQPAHASDKAAVYISGSATHKVPEPDGEDHLFYAVDGSVSRRDPRQPSLPQFERVGRGPVDPADVDADGVINEERA